MYKLQHCRIFIAKAWGSEHSYSVSQTHPLLSPFIIPADALG